MDRKDCIDCGPSESKQTFIGSAISSIVTNWDSWGIKDWANRNINGDKISQWWKSKVSFKNLFGGGNKNAAPPLSPPNMSSYVSLNNNSSTEVRSLLSRFKSSNNQYIIDPEGKPDFSPQAASRLTQAVYGLPTAFGYAGRPTITFGEIYKDVAHTVFGSVKIDSGKIKNNLQYAALLFHEYRHSW
nr:hypothetical protein [uncultured Flavobacterium sp.]